MPNVVLARAVATTALLWVAATLLEATILTAQEHVPFIYGVISSAMKYGILALLAWPVWHISSWIVPTARVVFVSVHLLMGVIVIVVWQVAYYGFLYLLLGSLDPFALTKAAGGKRSMQSSLTVCLLWESQRCRLGAGSFLSRRVKLS